MPGWGASLLLFPLPTAIFNAWTGTLLEGACGPPSEILTELVKGLDKVGRRGRDRYEDKQPGIRTPVNLALSPPNYPYVELPPDATQS